MLSAFAALAVVLGACGVSALAGYRVSERRREIAVRLAFRIFTGCSYPLGHAGDDMVLATLGVAIGAAAAFASTGVLRSQLHGVGPFDPLTLLGVSALLSLAAFVSAWAPARVAAAIDPAKALRQT